MNIAVCIKQVPLYNDGNMDEKTGLLNRSGLASGFNTYDITALECALRIKEMLGGEVSVFTMGPKSAEKIIREAFAFGADKGYLISDACFGGADVLSTSYTLIQGINSQGDYDLILCGKQTTDGDTQMISGALAKWLEIPHYNNVCELVEADEEFLKIKMETEKSHITQKITLPAVLAVEKTIFPQRMPSLKLKMQANKKDITIITKDCVDDKDEKHYGLKGSATKVTRVFPPPRTEHQEVNFYNGDEAVACIKNVLDTLGF